jgi:hypothetical protein
MPESPRRPGDQILDRYCPDLSPEERELAHERLRAFARALIRIERRLIEENVPPRDSTQSGTDDRIPGPPTS